MDAKGDLEKYLLSIGATRLPRGTNHDRWSIGDDMIEVPDNITGGRTFRNYRADAKRKAIRQGLLSSRQRPHLMGSVEAKCRKQRKRLRLQKNAQPSAEEGTAEDVEIWRRQNLFNELAHKLRFIKEARVGGPMRTYVSSKERVAKAIAAITEAGKPLNYKEICAAAGWVKPYDKEAARRVLNKAIPKHLRVVPTEQKRYPKFDLAENAPRLPAVAAATGAVIPRAASEPEANVDQPSPRVVDLERQVAMAHDLAIRADEQALRYLRLLRKVREKIIAAKNSDHARAANALGFIEGLLEDLKPDESNPQPES